MSRIRRGGNHANPSKELRKRRAEGMTVPELRERLRVRGINVPIGTRKPDLVRIFAQGREED